MYVCMYVCDVMYDEEGIKEDVFLPLWWRRSKGSHHTAGAARMTAAMCKRSRLTTYSSSC